MSFRNLVKMAYHAYRYPGYTSETFLQLSRLAEQWERLAQPQPDTERGYTLRACAVDVKVALGIKVFGKQQ